MTEKAYTQSPWTLADLYEGFDDPKFEGTFKQIKEGVKDFESYREKLSPDISEDLFLEIIKTYEKFYRLINRLYGFAQLVFASDTQDQEAQAAVAKVDQFQAEMSNQTLFFNLWWKPLLVGSDAQFHGLYAERT